jgi:hypothetical protein
VPGTRTALKERRASLKDERGPFCCGKELPAPTRVGLTSLRFFKGQTYYAGDTTPGDFQAGAQTVYDLTRSQAIDNYIAYYFALQDVEEVWQPTD